MPKCVRAHSIFCVRTRPWPVNIFAIKCTRAPFRIYIDRIRDLLKTKYIIQCFAIVYIRCNCMWLKLHFEFRSKSHIYVCKKFALYFCIFK